MADEDDDFVSLGTPFKQFEDDAPRKKPVPIHEQIVTDSRGRRRFHGAFTGGFSAGYFNTVGTKEGWAPSTFVSSRSKRAADATGQKPEDFMDEEDLSEFGIAPQRVVAAEKFAPKEGVKKPPEDEESSREGGMGADHILQNMVVPVKMSIGTRLLTQMGWKEGQGIGPRVRQVKKKVYGCVRPSEQQDHEEHEDIYAVGLMFAPKDVDSVSFKSKDNMHGIGYSGIKPGMALTTHQDWLGVDPAGKGKRVHGIKGKAFGVGAFEEEDEDIYSLDSMTNYDIPLSHTLKTHKSHRLEAKGDLFGWTGPPQSADGGGLLSIFTVATRPIPGRKFYPPPSIPREFKPFHKPSDTDEAAELKPQSAQPSTTNNKGYRLTAEARGKMLGEEPLPKPKKSVFDYISKEDKTRFDTSKDNRSKLQTLRSVAQQQAPTHTGLLGASASSGRSQEQTSGRAGSAGIPFESSTFKPFAKDPAKQARYEHFLKGDERHASTTGSGLTEWEREREQEEFSKSAMLYRPLSQTMASRFTSAKLPDEPSAFKVLPAEAENSENQRSSASNKMFGTLTRETFPWHPDRILCKRFNIPDPHPGSGVVGVPLSHKPRQSGTSDSGIVSHSKALEPARLVREGEEKEVSDSKEQVSTTCAESKRQGGQSTSALLSGFASLTQRLKQNEVQKTDDTTGLTTEPKSARTNESVEPEKDRTSDPNVVQRPTMDIFKAIFADSSSDNESETSGAEDEDSAASESARDAKYNAGELKHSTSAVDKQSEFKQVVDSEHSTSTVEHTPTGTNSLTRGVEKSDDIPRLTFSPPALSALDESYGPALPSSTISGSSTKNMGQTSRSRENVRTSSCSDDDSGDSYRGKRTRKKKRRKARSSSENGSSEDERDRERRKKRKRREKKAKKKHKTKDKPEKWTEKPSKSTTEKRERYSEKRRDDSCERSRRKEKNAAYRDHNDDKKQTEKFGVDARSPDEAAPPAELSSSRVPGNSDIISKLKNIQALKEKRRMRAADFM